MSWLFAHLQYVLPKYWLTALIYRIARIRHVGFKNFLITQFAKLYDVNLDEVRLDVPNDFEHFNAFFIRELKHDARPIATGTDTLVSPVDGTISQLGTLRKNSILQAKGIDYALQDLLATDLDDATVYHDGSFATIYLAPYNYHRIHSPLAGDVVSASYVPGALFSVNAATAQHVPGLFARNERLIVRLDTAIGPVAVIMVGAMNVGSITTPWTGEIRPRANGMVENCVLNDTPRNVAAGDLLGWFNMGSTVVLLLPSASTTWDGQLEAGTVVRMGEALAATTAK
ncbi:MAG: archaetidylserine decarboxylase [Pseudomonadota bacterium]